MAIVKKPQPSSKPKPQPSKKKLSAQEKEALAEKFIAGAPNASNGAAAATGEPTFLRVTLRIEKSLADRIKNAAKADAASKHMEPNMNTYITQAMIDRVKRFEEKGI